MYFWTPWFDLGVFFLIKLKRYVCKVNMIHYKTGVEAPFNNYSQSAF
jgi:hypothetical protein